MCNNNVRKTRYEGRNKGLTRGLWFVLTEKTNSIRAYCKAGSIPQEPGLLSIAITFSDIWWIRNMKYLSRSFTVMNNALKVEGKGNLLKQTRLLIPRLIWEQLWKDSSLYSRESSLVSIHLRSPNTFSLLTNRYICTDCYMLVLHANNKLMGIHRFI